MEEPSECEVLSGRMVIGTHPANDKGFCDTWLFDVYRTNVQASPEEFHPMSALFQPYKLKDVSLRNRIAIPPMCQYTAEDGLINEWHRVHLAGLARGGAGLVIVEATAVSPEGRITPGCAGIWTDEQAQAFAPVVASIKAAGSITSLMATAAAGKPSHHRRSRSAAICPRCRKR
jgi:2,4-dienoyl-CoA reductase-like NADH-dependent reductase (Old Yellow Enzyme family)